MANLRELNQPNPFWEWVSATERQARADRETQDNNGEGASQRTTPGRYEESQDQAKHHDEDQELPDYDEKLPPPPPEFEDPPSPPPPEHYPSHPPPPPGPHGPPPPHHGHGPLPHHPRHPHHHRDGSRGRSHHRGGHFGGRGGGHHEPRGHHHGPEPFSHGPWQGGFGGWAGPFAQHQDRPWGGRRRGGGGGYGRRGGPDRRQDFNWQDLFGGNGFDMNNLGNFLKDTIGFDPLGGTGPQHNNNNNQRGAAGDNEKDFTPAVDVFDTPTAYHIHLSLPGAKKQDIDVSWSAESFQLIVSGIIHRPGDEAFLKTLAVDERDVGVFERKITLGTKRDPVAVEAEGIEARMEDGVLIVVVPKVKEEDAFIEVRKVDIL